MNRPTHMEEGEYDRSYQRKCGWLHRIVVRLTRKHINIVTKTVLSRAFERSQIDSGTLHVMAATCDLILWPERNVRPKTDNNHLPKRWWRKDKHGWPIETFKGKPVKSAVRIIFQNIRKLTG